MDKVLQLSSWARWFGRRPEADTAKTKVLGQ
jgi:hypothetical protein